MKLSVGIKTKLKTVIIVSLACAVIGPLFTGFAFGFMVDRIIKGMIGGFFILLVSSLFEIFVFQNSKIIS